MRAAHRMTGRRLQRMVGVVVLRTTPRRSKRVGGGGGW
jgi:hypothetical protein